MTAVQSETVEVPTPDGVADAYLSRPDDGAAHPGVLLFQDAFGVRPALRALADRLASNGYTVLTPNLFYRSGPAPVLDLPEFLDLGARPAALAALGPIMQALTSDVALRDIGAYLDWLAQSPLVSGDQVGLTGYCMGARLSLLTAGTYPDRVAAAAGFHGGRLATDAPDSPHLVVGNITAEVYFGHADNDASLPPEQIERLDKALTEAGVRYTTEVYPDAPHGFTQTDTSSYQAEGADRHWRELVALYARTLS